MRRDWVVHKEGGVVPQQERGLTRRFLIGRDKTLSWFKCIPYLSNPAPTVVNMIIELCYQMH